MIRQCKHTNAIIILYYRACVVFPSLTAVIKKPTKYLSQYSCSQGQVLRFSTSEQKIGTLRPGHSVKQTLKQPTKFQFESVNYLTMRVKCGCELQFHIRFSINLCSVQQGYVECCTVMTCTVAIQMLSQGTAVLQVFHPRCEAPPRETNFL
jgi:hypothetical protein